MGMLGAICFRSEGTEKTPDVAGGPRPARP